MFKFASLVLLCASALAADISGNGIIHVLQTADEKYADPSNKVGCLSTLGKIIKPNNVEADCSIFEKLSVYPYTLSTGTGNCTFGDESQPNNVDSKYGKGSYAFYCGNPSYEAQIYDQLYTLDNAAPYYLCFGDNVCFYDAKRVPQAGEALDLWEFLWGSGQFGITPGHVELQLLWEQR